MSHPLDGKVVIITGASSGIGAATAMAAARAGMDLLLNARRADRLDAVADQARSLGRRVTTVAGDVTDTGLTERLLDAARDELGGFDAVFSNAGYGMDKRIMSTTDDELRRMFEVNFFASFQLVTAAAQRLLEAGKPGHLIVCSSCLAKFTLPGHAVYSATKAAQNHFCRALRLELAGTGIEVSSVHPITTTTEFFEVSAGHSGYQTGGSVAPDHAPRAFVQSPQKVADAVIKCLRRPKPEVWTSPTTLFASALLTAMPRLYDRVMRKMSSKLADDST